jgi:hypothetical protein
MRDRERSIPFPCATTCNVVGAYEKRPFRARIACNHRNACGQTQQGDRGQSGDGGAYGIWDASINYTLNDQVTGFVGGVDEKMVLWSV